MMGTMRNMWVEFTRGNGGTEFVGAKGTIAVGESKRRAWSTATAENRVGAGLSTL